MSEMGEVLQGLGRVEGELKSLTGAVSRGHARIDKVEERIGKLEVGMGKIAVWGTVLATLGAAAVNAIAKTMIGAG